MANLNIALYTTSETGEPKSYVIFGDDTKIYREKIKAIGGHFTKNFTHSVPDECSCGWIISARKYELAMQLCSDPNACVVKKAKTTTKRKTKTTAQKPKMSAAQLLASLGLTRADVVSYLMQN